MGGINNKKLIAIYSAFVFGFIVFGGNLNLNAQVQVKGPLISNINSDDELVFGNEIIFRDREILKRLLGELRINYYYDIPELGVKEEDISHANDIANRIIEEISTVGPKDYQEDQVKDEADRDPRLPLRDNFRRASLNIAHKLQALANTDKTINKIVEETIIIRNDGSEMVYVHGIDIGAMNAAVRNLSLAPFIEQGHKFVAKSEFENARYYFYYAAAAGDAAGLAELVKLHIDNPKLTLMPNAARLIATIRPKGSLEVMRNLIYNYNIEVEELAWSTKEAKMYHRSPSAMVVAMAFLAAYGDENDTALFAGIPISSRALEFSVFWAMVENAADLNFSFGNSFGLFTQFCSSFLYRDAEGVDALIEKNIDTNIRRIMEPEKIDRRTYLQFSSYHRTQLSRCLSNSSVASSVWRMSEYDDSNDLFWIKQEGMAEKYKESIMNKELNIRSLNNIDYFDGEFDPNQQNASIYHELIDSYQKLTENIHWTGMHDRMETVGRGEKRAVYRAVQEKVQIALSADVNMIPRFANNKLQIGIQMNVAFGVGPSAGLAVVIGGHDKKMAAFQENGGIGMINKVLLEQNGVQKQLSYIRTTAGGTHIYELNAVDDSVLTGLLNVQMGAFDDQWHLNFPLEYSQYTLRHRLSNVEKEVLR